MVEFTGGRTRPINYQGVCHTIADSYPDGVAHGVQKDAIQNSVDARAGRAAVNVLFSLEQTRKGRFLTVADSGTKGLTGPVLDEVDEYAEELPADSHWARFESFAFTKDEPDAIGARGQGKFIFLRASSDFKMFYDTLRPDGIYRLGATKATTTGCPILPAKDDEPWEGDTARGILWENCELHPLTEVGTRVIIVNPTEEVVDEFENGFVANAIRETWFREIEKGRLTVAMRLGGELTEVELVSPYPVPETDSEGVQSWVLGTDFDEERILATGEQYRVKHFCAAHLSGPAREPETQGIAIIHNGMKIMSLPASMFPLQLRERCTGYIEFDRDLDRELRKGTNQHPNHYDLKWRRRLPRGIKQYVADRLSEFGRAKLGMAVDPREQRRRRRSAAEDWAMRELYRFAPDLDLFGKKGRRLSGDVPTPNAPSKTVGVTIHRFAFPDPEIAPRVNYGDRFDGLRLSAFNRSSEALDCVVKFSVLRGDSVVQVLVEHQSLSLDAASEEELGIVSLNIDPDTFDEAGQYRLKASLYDVGSGERLDQVIRRFWVETDPPIKRPFELSRQRMTFRFGGLVSTRSISFEMARSRTFGENSLALHLMTPMLSRIESPGNLGPVGCVRRVTRTLARLVSRSRLPISR